MPAAEAIIESLPVAVVAFDEDLRVVAANAAARDVIYLVEHIDESLAKGTTDESVRASWTEELRSVLGGGGSRTFGEVRYTKEEAARLLRLTCTAVKGKGRGRICAGMIVIEDVTERVEEQRHLAEAERLAAVGRLASKVAHELNNPMDGILRYLSLAARMVEREGLEKPKEYLSQCREGLMRMVQITSELLEFSRGMRAPLERVRIEQLVEEALRTLESTIDQQGVRIVRQYDRDIPQMVAGNLFQVFCNLTKNALEAMPQGGELRISTRLEGADTAVVEFRDTGGGFSPEEAELLFEPFFTTKGPGRGTGLGLAICRDIVERFEGRITAENAPGGGSIFTVFLPVRGGSAGGPDKS